MDQRTKEWFESRCGRFTGSEIHNLCGKSLTQTAMSYIIKKVAEEMTGNVETIRESEAMKWGTYHEPIARSLYEQIENIKVDEAGFVELNKHAGMSPDGIIPALKKGIEIKCPFTAHEHVKHILCFTPIELKTTKPEYYWQCLMGLLVFDYESWDFISYNPNFKGVDKMAILNIKRDEVEKDITFLKSRIDEAIFEKKLLLAKIYDIPFEKNKEEVKAEKPKREMEKKDELAKELAPEQNSEIAEEKEVNSRTEDIAKDDGRSDVQEPPKRNGQMVTTTDQWRVKIINSIFNLADKAMPGKPATDTVRHYIFDAFKPVGCTEWQEAQPEMLTDIQLSKMNAFFYHQAEYFVRMEKENQKTLEK